MNRKAKRNRAWFEDPHNFTKTEMKLLAFIRKYFELSSRARLIRNTIIADLGKSRDLHAAINFSFALEKAYDFDLTDEEAQAVETGNIQMVIKILKSHKLLGKEVKSGC